MAVRSPRVTVATPWRIPTRWWPVRPRFGRSRVGKMTNAPRGRAQHVGAALGPRALLEQHELAAVEVVAGAGEHGEDLEREEDLPVEVLVQGVPVARAVAEDERRSPA